MNVLILTTVFPPEVRSAAQIMWELAETLHSRGHEVTVITGRPGAEGAGRGALVSHERLAAGLQVIRVPTVPIHKTHAPAVLRGVGQVVNSLTYLGVALAVRKADVSLAYSPPLPLGIVGAALYRLRGVLHVLNVQDLVPQYAIDLGILKNRALIRTVKWIERAIYRNVQQISVHSPGNAAYMACEGVPRDRVAVVPNWVDTGLIRPVSPATRYRREAGLGDKFVALFAGQLGFAQDLDTVVEAGAVLRDRSDIVLLIVGDGVEKPRLEAKARQLGLRNVRFMPCVSKEEYPEVVASADVCLATLQKSLACPVVPSKIVGYMAAGRPVIASFPEGGDAPRVIREAGSGICVPPGKPSELARAILQAYENREECRRWGERGRAFVEAHHDRARCIALYESLFERLSGASPSAQTLDQGRHRAESRPSPSRAARSAGSS